MASTWSNLGINLQGTGDNSGTWGQLTNVNLQDFDYAISGVAAITLTGNTTLAFTTNSSSTTYSNESGRAAVLVLSGSLSATTVTVTVPNIQKNYVIINNSGATATISAGGSTTVSLGTSTSAYVYSNGSSSIFTAITSNPGGTTNQVQYNNAGAFAGSTNLTFNGTTLAMQTATALNLTVTSLTATNATVTTDNITTANITTANVTTANVTSLTYVNATGTTGNIANVNVITNGTLKLYNTANTFYTGLKVAAGATTTATFTLPSADGTSGQFLKTNGSGVLSFGAASAITWQSVQTTNFTASAGNGYPVNTTSAGITVTLPVSASTGDTIQIVDYAGTFATNALTLNPNSLKIQSQTSNVIVSKNNEALTLTYIDSTSGWLVSSAANEGTSSILIPYSVDFLVISGGGSGGTGNGGNGSGGGGAGGYRTSTQSVAAGTVITITVGDGGAAVNNFGTQGNKGSDSSISGSGLTTITSTGGGRGGSGYGGEPGTDHDGGSGGGGGGYGPSTSATAGAGNTPSTSPSQGNNGGNGAGLSGALDRNGGGGGGSGATGTAGTSGASGAGGNGTASSITGSSVTRAGGGGGSGCNTTPNASGGSGGGGAGGYVTGTAGTANTGSGGGGAGINTPMPTSGAGGKGVVILSVPTSKYSGTTTGSPTVTTSGSNTILQFNGSGSYTA